MRRIAIIALALLCLFCLYSAISFHILQDISSPEQLPRVRYDRNFWLVLLLISLLAEITLMSERRFPKPRRLQDHPD